MKIAMLRSVAALVAVAVGGVALAVTLAGPAPARADIGFAARIARHRATLARSPTDLDARLALVDLLVRAGRLDEGEAELGLLDALMPGAPPAAILRARLLVARGELEEAVSVLTPALGREPPVDGLILRAAVFERLDRLEEALVDLDELAARAPAIEHDLTRGRLYEQLGRLDEAALAYEEGLARSGATPLHRARIDLERRRGQPARALSSIDALIASARVAPRLRVLRAEVLREAGRGAEARTELARALADAERMLARRRSALALMERGRARLALGDHAAARADLEQALRRAPRLTEARTLLVELDGGAR